MIQMQTLNLSGFCGSKCDNLSYCSESQRKDRSSYPLPASPSGSELGFWSA